ncbi:hypothetical protein GWO43_04125 [candidate division KSB1 bacterium]|nr:hypothetical protein [candidate division KSB1 bacterium]NIR70772.1 hypothetical protein [candidate division KSB1 bacterium]NIS23226.1 hypothetical protein [candidate division KSB1 bacterium]NIT70086.1 hypothetical protein [candidate division KSB1 bacterium]NIU23722.1 hypothetical protein [candidate division KSB1 bacterium]
MKPVTLFVLVILAFSVSKLFVGCSEGPDIKDVTPPSTNTNQGNRPITASSDALTYSGAVVIGGEQIPWTGQSGIVLFVVVRNNSDLDWRGHPEAAVYAIDLDGSRGLLLATGKGVLTKEVNREPFAPTDNLQYVSANSERESITFVPVDFSANPRVFVYWRFVGRDNSSFSFQQTMANPKAQPLMSTSEAKTLLQAQTK